ncbi:MAG: AMP-binding protein [Bacteroidota bacterium]
MEFRRIFDLLTSQNEQYAVFHDKKDLQWQALTIREGIDRCNRMSAGLLNLGLEAGDRIAICASVGSSYWMLLLQAALQIELVVVPINPTTPSKQLIEIMRTTRPKFALVESRAEYLRFQEIAEGLQHFNRVLAFFNLPGLESFEDHITEPSAAHLETLQMFKAAIHKDDLAFIIYQDNYLTYYSHKQILDQVQDLFNHLSPKRNQKALSVLPPGYLLELLLLHVYLATGLSIYFSNQSLYSALLEVKPDFLGLKPIQVEDLRDYFYAHSTRATRISRKRTIWSIKIGEAYSEEAMTQFKYRLQFQLADWWRFRKWRRLLGGYLRSIIVDKSIKESTDQLFKAAFIPVLKYIPELKSPEETSAEN